MSIELKVPAVGESITEVQIGEWLKAEGDHAEKDENLVEIETDKATVELPAPVSGRIAKMLKRNGDTAAVGEVIGYMEESAADPADQEAAAAAQAQAADMIRTPAKRQAESLQGGSRPRPNGRTPRRGEQAQRQPAAKTRNRLPRRPMSRSRRPGRRPPVRRSDRGLVVSPEVPRPARPARQPERGRLAPRRFRCRLPRPGMARARKKRCR